MIKAGHVVWCVLGLAAAWALVAAPHFPSRPPRVLVDDYHSGYWAPAGRPMSDTWYGDFATYNMAALVEELSYCATVTVNAGRDLSREVLLGQDVLVLKIPQTRYSSEELEAMHAFMASGGGILVVADHTNLLGHAHHLNELLDPIGIHVNNDAVVDPDRGAFTLFQPGLSRHPVLSGVERVEFMTGCSLAVSARATPIMRVGGQRRIAGDYGNGSNFGTAVLDFSGGTSDVVLMAEVQCGKGCCIVFADSTVWSSFAAFVPDRERLFLNAIERCYDAPIWWTTRPYRWMAVACCATLLYLLSRPRQRLSAFAIAAGTVGLALLTCGGECASRRVTARAERAPSVEWWAHNSRALLPPVLGVGEDFDWAHAYDTFYASIPRAGVFPRIVSEMQSVPRGGSLLLLNGARALTPAECGWLQPWLNDGGRLCLVDELTMTNDVLLKQVAEICGGSMESEIIPGVDTRSETAFRIRVLGFSEVKSAQKAVRLLRREVGRGVVVVALGAEAWSHARLGHCFSRPSAERRQAYMAIGEMLRAAGIAPKERAGYVVLDGVASQSSTASRSVK